MIRNILTIGLVAILLTACGARSFGNKIDDQFIGPEVLRAIKDAHIDLHTSTSRIVLPATAVLS